MFISVGNERRGCYNAGEGDSGIYSGKGVGWRDRQIEPRLLCVQIRGWVAEALGSEKWRMASLHGLTVQLFSFTM